MVGAVRAAAELTGKSAIELATLVRRGEIGPAEVTRAHLDRIERLEPSIGAFQVVRAEKALAEARELEARPDLASLPLAGVPVAIKDNVDVAGEPTRQGSRATAAHPVSADDELVRRLRRAGCIIIGKTRMPELAIWPLTEPEAYGSTHNPWDPTRTPGGSTGGGGAAVAASMAVLALGSDGGGSLRIPAACCGVVGFKPGPGIVPLAGGMQAHWCGMTEFGPIARTVSDAALMLDVLAGSVAYENPPRPEGSLRIAVSSKAPTAGARVAREVRTAVEETASLLRTAGHVVVHGDPPYPFSLGMRFSRRWLPGIADDADALATTGVDTLERRTQAMVRMGRWLKRRGWVEGAAADSLGPRMRRWFLAYDVLLMPTTAVPPVPIGKWKGKHWISTTLGVANWICTPPWNLVGFPAMSVPAGLSHDGLPLAVQLVGVPGTERTLLALAKQLEELRPWLRWGS
jgi:amidase